jgi:hypothetical protein
MTTHDELLEFLEELSAFSWLAEQVGAERLLLDEVEALKNLVETMGSAAWHQTVWRAQRHDDLVHLSLAALHSDCMQQASEQSACSYILGLGRESWIGP